MVLNTAALAENQDLATWQSRRRFLQVHRVEFVVACCLPFLACAIIRRIEARRCVQQVATTRIWLFLASPSCLEHPSLGATGRARGCGSGRSCRLVGPLVAPLRWLREAVATGDKAAAAAPQNAQQARKDAARTQHLAVLFGNICIQADKAMGQPPAPIVLHVRQQETCCIASCLGEASALDVRGIKSCGS